MNLCAVVAYGLLLSPAVWHLAIVSRRVARSVSIATHRLIGPCGSCGWPVARGHRPDCPRH